MCCVGCWWMWCWWMWCGSGCGVLLLVDGYGCYMASSTGAAVRSGMHGWMECVRVAAGRQSDRERGRGACGLCGADLAQVGGWWCVGSWYVCPAGPLMIVHQSAGRVRAVALPERGDYVGLGFFPTSSCNARGRVCTGPLLATMVLVLRSSQPVSYTDAQT